MDYLIIHLIDHSGPVFPLEPNDDGIDAIKAMRGLGVPRKRVGIAIDSFSRSHGNAGVPMGR